MGLSARVVAGDVALFHDNAIASSYEGVENTFDVLTVYFSCIDRLVDLPSLHHIFQMAHDAANVVLLPDGGSADELLNVWCDSGPAQIGFLFHSRSFWHLIVENGVIVAALTAASAALIGTVRFFVA